VEGERFFAHRIIISPQSPPLRALAEQASGKREVYTLSSLSLSLSLISGEVEVDARAVSFRAVMEFLYTGATITLKESARFEDLMDCMSLAARFQVKKTA
jgi:hypothetical protein